MKQVSYFGAMVASPDRANALITALSISAGEFEFDDESHSDYDMVISDDFKKYFPATHPGRTLSGLWDLFDTEERGYGNKEYHEPHGVGRPYRRGALFFSPRGIIEPAISVMKKLCNEDSWGAVWWRNVDCHPEQASSGCVVVRPEGVKCWEVSSMREAIAAGGEEGDAALEQLVTERRHLLEAISELVAGNGERSNDWTGWGI